MIKCDFCGEEEAVTKRPNPNGVWDISKRIWDVCWECNEFIKWTFEQMIAAHFHKEIKPFDEWLFEKHQVYPKHESISCIVKKKEGVK